jgi:hypothetical protein
MMLPRHVLNSKDMPLHDGALPGKYPGYVHEMQKRPSARDVLLFYWKYGLLFLGGLRLSAFFRNEVRLVHTFFQVLLIELMYVLVVGSGLLIGRDSLFLENPIALHCVSLVGYTLIQYRKRAPKVSALTAVARNCWPPLPEAGRHCPKPPAAPPKAAGR